MACHSAISPFPARLQLNGFLDELGIVVCVIYTGDVGRCQKSRSEVVRMCSDEVCPKITSQVRFERIPCFAEPTFIQMFPGMFAGRQNVFSKVLLCTKIYASIHNKTSQKLLEREKFRCPIAFKITS